MTTIRLYDGCLGDDDIFVRCDLTRASAPVEVNYHNDGSSSRWEPTQYQCADARHTLEGLAALGQSLAEQACQWAPDEDEPADTGRCNWEEAKCECGCECGEDMDCWDDQGNPVCDDCADYCVDDDGQVICAHMTRGFSRCHVCGERIEWGCVQTRQFCANWSDGGCKCGETAWRREDHGGRDVYSYGTADEDGE